jgi:phosphohistidine phosphatase SixA
VRRRELLLGALGAALVPSWAYAGDADAWRALRAGGLVILMRHAATEGQGGDSHDMRVDDCATQRNLSEAGREQARRLGARLRAERVKIARVYTSPWCRCRETAQLAFGTAEDWEPLGSFFERPDLEAEATLHVKRRILGYSIRKPAGNVVMVTHNLNIASLTKLSVAPAEMVMVRPDGCCGLRVVDRLKVGE